MSYTTRVLVLSSIFLAALLAVMAFTLVPSRETPARARPTLRTLAAAGRAPEKVRRSSETGRRELIRVVERQLEALRKNDYVLAFTFASSRLHDQFTASGFRQMMQTGYPIINWSRAAEFGASYDDEEEALLGVAVTGESGETRYYQYLFQREGKDWKIAGVVEQRPHPEKARTKP